ncbi:MAG: hypothetical protein ACRD8W_16765, partial [Nitrososphaeraceae archaeon]
ANTGLTVLTEGAVANSSAIPIVIPLSSNFIIHTVVSTAYIVILRMIMISHYSLGLKFRKVTSRNFGSTERN